MNSESNFRIEYNKKLYNENSNISLITLKFYNINKLDLKITDTVKGIL